MNSADNNAPRRQGGSEAVSRRAPARSIRRHAFGWLAAANAIGVLLAVLLLWPELNETLAPLTYGRWMPLHLDWQLYGWCALPLAGLLFGYFLPATRDGARAGSLALACWSLGLAFGGASWLAGLSGGKVFLEWSGPARLVWLLAMLSVWVILFTQVWPRRREFPLWAHALLALLFAVPFLLHWSEGPEIYPAVDPDTGGATGRSLLGSTLGIIGVFGAVPWLLRLPGREPTVWWRRRRIYAAMLAASAALAAALHAGNVAHHDVGHLVGLATLLLWIPLVWNYARMFTWPEPARAWLAAAFGWWLLLVVSGFVTYLPDVADRLKFTNGLVAHAHLAMAGVVTGLHQAILAALAPGGRGPRWAFAGWQLGLAAMFAALLVLGWAEGGDPSLLYVRGGLADACYGLRLAAGLMMLAASVAWLVGAMRAEADDHEATN